MKKYNGTVNVSQCESCVNFKKNSDIRYMLLGFCKCFEKDPDSSYIFSYKKPPCAILLTYKKRGEKL